MSIEQLSAIKEIAKVAAKAITKDSARNPLALSAEGHTRVVVATALAADGCQIVEPKGSVVKQIKGRTGLCFSAEHSAKARPPRSGRKPDLKIVPRGLGVDPENQLFLEIKTRSAFSGSASASQGFDKDLDQIRRGETDIVF